MARETGLISKRFHCNSATVFRLIDVSSIFPTLAWHPTLLSMVSDVLFFFFFFDPRSRPVCFYPSDFYIVVVELYAIIYCAVFLRILFDITNIFIRRIFLFSMYVYYN